MAPTLYMFRGSPPVRSVLITAKALGISLNIHLVSKETAEIYSPEFLMINPQHTVPVLDDNGNIICESHAINAYLVGKYGKDDSLYPKDLYKRALVDQRLHFDNGVPFATLRHVVMAFVNKELKEITPNYHREFKEALEFTEKFLKGKEWIAGDHVTIADFSCVTTVTTIFELCPWEEGMYSNVDNWIKRAKALPCFSEDQEQIEHFMAFFKTVST